MQSILLDDAPIRVEIRGGILYYHHTDAVYSQPVDAALRTAALIQKAVVEWQAGLRDNVVTLGIPGEH